MIKQDSREMMDMIKKHWTRRGRQRS